MQPDETAFSESERPENGRPADAAAATTPGEGADLGTVQIHNNVVATIAREAALKVPGVVDLSGGLADNLAGILGKKAVDRGLRIVTDETSLSLDVHVILDYGVNIPHVAWQLQQEVRAALQQMTGKTVKAVHVIVQSLRMPTEQQANAPEGGNA